MQLLTYYRRALALAASVMLVWTALPSNAALA